jgi:hypothetical protein
VSEALLRKLGLKPGTAGQVVGRPEALAGLPLKEWQEGEQPDWLMAFVHDKAAVPAIVARLLPAYRTGRHLWFAYPKKSGSIRTDISRDAGWEPLAERDMLPCMQVAIDADWSALRFRRRDEIKNMTRASDLPGKRAKA